MRDDFGSEGDDPEALVVLPPAPLGPRLAAGILDAGLVAALSSVFLLVPLMLGGFVLPMLAVFAAVLLVVVVPLWLFRATPGYRLFGLQLVGLDGRRADLMEVMFREFVGRGMFAVAYLGTFLLGLLAMLLGTARLTAPEGMAAVLTQLAVGLLLMAGAGHLLILARPDRRGLADLVGKTQAIPRRAEPPQEDPEEQAELSAESSKRKLRFAAFAVLLIAGAVGGPWILGSRSSDVTGGNDRMARIKLKQQAADFALAPWDEELAESLVRGYSLTGDEEALARVQREHLVALEQQAEQRAAERRLREEALVAKFEASPTDEELAGRLLEIYEESGRMEEARGVYVRMLEADPSPGRRAALGIFLFENDRNAEAVTELQRSLTEGAEGPVVKAYLGFSLRAVDRKEDARRVLRAALAEDPELEDVREELAALDRELGPDRSRGPRGRSGTR